MNIRHAALTDPGMRRSENQDSVLAVERDGAYLFVVADGVGGLQDGAAASNMAIQYLEDAFANLPPDGRMDHIQRAIEQANAEIGKSRGGGKQPVSATTVVLMLLEPNAASVAHVGDSRAYRSNNGTLLPLTEDHSLVVDQVKAGIITPEEALTSSNRHVVTRSVGAMESVRVDRLEGLDVEPDDIFLLCSDGLTDVVDEVEIQALLRSGKDEEATARALVDLANERGGPDNISVIVVRIGEDPGG